MIKPFAVLFISALLSISLSAQQQPIKPSPKFAPPKVIRDKDTARHKKSKKTPPKVNITKFKPPVIKKDSAAN